MGKDEKVCAFWIHVGFHGNHIVFTKDEIDGAVKDKDGKHFEEGFTIELFLTD
jgi:hypothetical protein